MKNTSRLMAFILAVAMLCGMITVASAEVATLGIYFCGKRTAADGSESVIRLSGQFRVTRNGEEVGVIDAGKTTVTLSGTDRVRIAPMPETISPEWDLRGAAGSRRNHHCFRHGLSAEGRGARSRGHPCAGRK